MTKFRNEIILYACIMAAVAELISLFVSGPEIMFPVGLVIGTGISVAGFIILVCTGQLLLAERNKSPVMLGYIFRILLYGVSFLICIKTDLHCGAGCGIGFITIHCAILFLYGIVYKFIRKKKNPLNDWSEPKQWNDLSVYDEDEDDNWKDW